MEYTKPRPNQTSIVILIWPLIFILAVVVLQTIWYKSCGAHQKYKGCVRFVLPSYEWYGSSWEEKNLEWVLQLSTALKIRYMLNKASLYC